jgi:HPt (histidine-containing phosphotransfer) domain-containing protein
LFLPNESDELVDTNRSVGACVTDSNIANFQNALKRLQGARPLLLDMIHFFREDAPELIDEIAQAVQLGDAARARRACHSLKGLAANFDGHRVVGIAKELEMFARENDLQAVVSELDPLRDEVGRLIDAMDRYVAQSTN